MSDKNTILVVEDELSLANAIKLKLQHNGFEVVSARSATQAIDYMNSLKEISAVWLDHYLLGGEEGIDLVVKMKGESSPWRKVPVFLVSNTATPDKIKSYIALGVNKYFTKANSKLDDIVLHLKELLDKEE